MTRNSGAPRGDHDDEMRMRPLDDELETALTGDPSEVTGAWAVVADVAAELRQVAAEEPPPPSHALTAALADPASVMETQRPTAPARGDGWWSRLSIRGRSLLAGMVALASVGGAGVAGALPGPLQDGVARVVEAVTPFDLPDSTDRQEHGSVVEDTDDGDVADIAPNGEGGRTPEHDPGNRRGGATDGATEVATERDVAPSEGSPAGSSDGLEGPDDDSVPDGDGTEAPGTADEPEAPGASADDDEHVTTDPSASDDPTDASASDDPTPEADDPTDEPASDEPSSDETESPSASESESDDAEAESSEAESPDTERSEAETEEPSDGATESTSDDPDADTVPDDGASELRDREGHEDD